MDKRAISHLWQNVAAAIIVAMLTWLASTIIADDKKLDLLDFRIATLEHYITPKTAGR